MKRWLALVFLALCDIAMAAPPTPVQHAIVAGYYSGTSPTIALSGVGSGDTLILQLSVGGSGQTISSVSDSNGTVANCVALSNPGASGLGAAVYDVASTASGTHTLTVNFTVSGGQAYVLALAEYSGLAASSPCDQAGTNATGTGNTLTANSITPSQSGELVVSLASQQFSGNTVSSWTNSFTQEDSSNSVLTSGWAQYIQASAASISTGVTINGNSAWVISIASFKPASGSSCTHAGWTKDGAFTVPIAGSTLVWLKNGAFGTVDCSTTNYWQQSGAFGVN